MSWTWRPKLPDHIRRTVLAALLVTAVGFFCLGRLVAAEAPPPGSEGDPLVARSYVDQYTVWRLISLETGQKLLANAGCEIVVRAGSVTTIASADGGLSDLTAGQDLGQGTILARNHLLLVPRSDGRGVQAVSATVLLVKGAFTVQ